MIGSAVNEQRLRRYLDEAHRQLLERDNAFRLSEEQMHKLRERQVRQLLEELANTHTQLATTHKQLVKTHEDLVKTQTWANEIDATIREMQRTRAWRFANSLRSLSAGARRLTRLGR
jgi:transposase